MYKTVMKRGPKPDMVREDATEARAMQRADSLLDLHGLNTSKMSYDASTRTFTIDASDYYDDTTQEWTK